MNEMIRAADHALVNPFAAYAEETSQSNLLRGDLLKFTKGRWTVGQNNARVADGTTYIVDMNEVLVGWQQWANKKVVAAQMGAIATGYRAAQRGSLGSLDESEWETDEDGKAQDPWQLTSVVYLKDKNGDDYTYSTSSYGGRNAVADLCKQYGSEMAKHPGESPIVAVGSDEYEHKKYGLTFTPTLKIVGWTGSTAADQGGSEPLLEQKAAPATGKAKF